MKVSDVSENDGLMFASIMQIMAVADKLFDALKLAGLPVSGPGMDNRSAATKWLREHSQCLADAIKADRAKADQSIKVTAMGPNPGSPSPAPKPAKAKKGK